MRLKTQRSSSTKPSNVNSDEEEKTRSKSSTRHSHRLFDFDAGENWTSSRQVANITLNYNNNPQIVSYPAFHAPVSTPFRCYSQKKRKTTNKTLIKNNDDAEVDELLVVGETKSVEFVSDEGESRKAANLGCRYAFNSSSCLLPDANEDLVTFLLFIINEQGLSHSFQCPRLLIY